MATPVCSDRLHAAPKNEKLGSAEAASAAGMAGSIRVGVGGWTFEPWRGPFYPDGLPQKQELHFASRALTSIEINGTYYSTFKPPSWIKWREETPDGFVFSVKASRYCTNRKDLRTAKEPIERFLSQGLLELGDKLGPINWQLMATKKFDPEEMAGFLDLLPREHQGAPLRHAIEPRHASFVTEAFYKMARERGVAIVCAEDEDFPEIDTQTSNFTYARFMTSSPDEEIGVSSKDLIRIANRTKDWAKRGDVFAYFIAGAKEKNPAAAQALIKKLGFGRK
jgi:uncharacterized protein YecE (DUF72 family)